MYPSLRMLFCFVFLCIYYVKKAMSVGLYWSARSVRYFTNRYVGFGITLLLLVSCSLVMLCHLHLAVLTNKPTRFDVCLTVLFLSLIFLAFWSFGFCSFVNPGLAPAWLAESRVEGFVRRMLSDLQKMEEVGTDWLNTTDPQEDSSSRIAMKKALAVLQERARRDSCGSSGSVANYDTVGCSERDSLLGNQQQHEVPLRPFRSDPDQTAPRRRESPESHSPMRGYSRQFLRVVSEAIGALDSTPENFEQEMSFLLGGIRWCRYCLLYKLDETHHCSTCRSCVYHMNNHCPWIGQCIGRGNHKCLLLFVGYVSLAALVVVIHAIIAVRSGKVKLLSLDASISFSFFFLVCVFTVLVMVPFLVTELRWLARGEGALRAMRRLIRQRHNPLHGGESSSGAGASADSLSHRSKLQNLRLVFGTDDVFPYWFLPTFPQWPPREEQEAAFWDKVGDTIVKQLVSAMVDELEDGSVGVI
ncbi:hypothetical protein, conserved [Trypanosoma brucei gambiense DAL972]|uniref:Palmitoyltransferase n=1 Tax=Trypanosoma brucei gambiense (strain MHOM/CI/86/DAL972) TaxID=679716 RepID=D0A6R2_TRYB9|nr:hypothetical protein, conserved [Trypanosoma brucei gambiense DAL972]CBH17363.1 hypothetical protein, conserved [Trypanosoma brucei gambiense DAL972]|eukprot:XP_011779627.1 hypothetical protein, conserved [Trypanosoma brucei gambiense DAL972]